MWNLTHTMNTEPYVNECTENLPDILHTDITRPTTQSCYIIQTQHQCLRRHHGYSVLFGSDFGINIFGGKNK